jgi:CHAD domain-containing protein
MAKAKKIEGLSCETSAAENIRLILDGRLGEMCGFRAAALDWSDAGGVYDMRVASRRLRSALQDFKPYLRRRKLAAAVSELKRIARALGAVRDEDVALAALEELQGDAPAAEAAGIAVLADERRRERETARAALAKAITEETLLSFREEFAVALEKALKPRRKSSKRKRSAAALSFGEVAPEVARERVAELRESSRSLYEPFAVDGLHRMRIAAKRLRYAMQLFAACLNETLAEQAAEVGELQTSLGKLHDCDVWLEALGRTLADLRAADKQYQLPLNGTAGQKQRAAVWLLCHFAAARMKHYGHALARWHEWETSDFFERLADSLKVVAR